MKKDVVAGLGEIGSAILKLLSKKQVTVGYDLDKKLVDESKLKKYQDTTTSFLHIAIPVTPKFDSNLQITSKKAIKLSDANEPKPFSFKSSPNLAVLNKKSNYSFEDYCKETGAFIFFLLVLILGTRNKYDEFIINSK